MYVEVNGVKIAFLAYAEHINGFSIPEDSSLRVIMNYEEDVIERQIKKPAEIADAVIVRHIGALKILTKFQKTESNSPIKW